MKKKGFWHIFKKSNTIKILTLILLVVLPLIGILAYNKSLFEAMTINIYGSGKDYEASKEGSSGGTDNSNSNKYKKNSEEIYTAPPPAPAPASAPAPAPAPAPKTSLADNASSNVENAKDKAKEAADAIKNKTSSYMKSFTNPLKQTQTED